MLVAITVLITTLTAVGMLGILCNLLLARVVSAKRINITRALMRDESRQASSIIGGIRQIESLKASGAEAGFFAEWAGYQAAVNRDRVRYRMLDASFGSVVRTITILVNVCVFAIGVYYVIQGAFSVGMLIAFTGFLEAFLQPAQTIVESGQTIQEMRSKMERIRDVMEYPLDDTFVDRETADSVFPETISKLSGEICLSHVTFGYSKMEEPLLKDICLSVKAGSRVALVGSTGCGKSTVANLLLGLYRPWSGEILYDGKRISQIDRRVFTGSVAAVDQDIILYGDTIQANLKTWDESIEDFEVILAARDASIHEEIMQRPDGYLTMLSENGRNFSGGQRQRLEIARVLAQDPTIVIMDEATSALDAGTEAEVVEAIKARGITCIMIAHRLSTIRHCDRILVLDEGRIAEDGSYEALMEANGLFAQLVRQQQLEG